MNVRALREGLKVAEVPSFEGKRIHGTSNLHTFSDGWRVLKTIFKERFGLLSGQSASLATDATGQRQFEELPTCQLVGGEAR